MEQLEHSTAAWHAYVAGFFDGEGCVCIARVRANGRSDYHKILVTVTQREHHRLVLDRICDEFGGCVVRHRDFTRIGKQWSPTARWQLQGRAGIETFLRTIQPYAIVKVEAIRIGLEFLSLTKVQNWTTRRGHRGFILGRNLDQAEVARREGLRLALGDVNRTTGNPIRSALPPLDYLAGADSNS